MPGSNKRRQVKRETMTKIRTLLEEERKHSQEGSLSSETSSEEDFGPGSILAANSVIDTD